VTTFLSTTYLKDTNEGTVSRIGVIGPVAPDYFADRARAGTNSLYPVPEADPVAQESVVTTTTLLAEHRIAVAQLASVPPERGPPQVSTGT
jgi:hypothetical protein